MKAPDRIMIKTFHLFIFLTLIVLLLSPSSTRALESSHDSRFRVKCELPRNESWQAWCYDFEKRDYAGTLQPHGFNYIERVGFRKADYRMIHKPIDALIMIRKKSGGVRSIRSRLDWPGLRKYLNSISSIEGAYIEKDNIYLVGKKRGEYSKPIALLPEDIVVAMRTVANSKVRGAMVNIKTPPGETTSNYGLIEYSGLIKNSHVGQVLFESDRLLKCISLGSDNILREEIPKSREYHMNKFDFREPPKNSTTREEWHKFWFFFNEMRIERDDKNMALRFKDEKISVRTERMKKGSQTDTYFEDSHKTETGKFSKHLSDNLNSFSSDYIAFREMLEISKLIAIAKWLLENNIVIKFNKKDIGSLYCRYTPLMTPRVTVSFTRRLKDIDLRRYSIVDVEMNSVGGIDMKNFTFKKKKLLRFRKDALNDPEYVVYKLF